MGEYRKYLSPEYGEVSPEVYIMKPQVMDLYHTKEWRIKSNYESIAGITAAYQKCNCFDKVMRVMTEDVECVCSESTIKLRIFIPEQAENCPVLIFYHGGAFSMNSIDVYEYICRYLSYYGNLIVVTPEYHLAPEFKFPKGLNEAYDTLLWTAKHISEYHGNPVDISVGGDSSGGNFAAVTAIISRDKKGPKISRQILYYPLTTNYEREMTDSEQRYGTGYFLEYNCMADPMSLYFEEGAKRCNPLASPLLADCLQNLPPACFISAECDPLLDQGLMYAAKLEDHGVPVEYHIMTGMVHGFLNWTYGKSFEAMNIAIEFMKDR